MINIKSAAPTLSPNLRKLPVIQTDSIDEWNEVYLKFVEMERKGVVKYGIESTRSGGISYSNICNVLQRYMVTTNSLGAELLVLAEDEDDTPYYFRLQYRNEVMRDSYDDSVICGTKAYRAFCDNLRKWGYNIEDYYIADGKEVASTIESAIIRLESPLYKDIVLDNCHHLDIRSAYPSYMAEYIPEWRPMIEWLFYNRKERPENKHILNLACGYFRSRYCGWQLSHISKYAVESTNKRLMEMRKYLLENDRSPILYNTDGIWYNGDSLDIHGDKLGDWNQDYTNVTLRCKSKGIYEFTEPNGKYHVVLRGKCRLDQAKPRNQWEWGDIYKTDALEYTKIGFNRDRGLIHVTTLGDINGEI